MLRLLLVFSLICLGGPSGVDLVEAQQWQRGQLTNQFNRQNQLRQQQRQQQMLQQNQQRLRTQNEAARRAAEQSRRAADKARQDARAAVRRAEQQARRKAEDAVRRAQQRAQEQTLRQSQATANRQLKTQRDRERMAAIARKNQALRLKEQQERKQKARQRATLNTLVMSRARLSSTLFNLPQVVTARSVARSAANDNRRPPAAGAGGRGGGDDGSVGPPKRPTLRDTFRKAAIEQEVDASTPVGRSLKKRTIQVLPGTNKNTYISGRLYTGHALDRMQMRGHTPAVIENTVQNGVKSDAEPDGTLSYHDKENNVTVVTNKNGDVITVRDGE